MHGEGGRLRGNTSMSAAVTASATAAAATLRTDGANDNERLPGISPAKRGARLYRRKRGDEAAKRCLRGCAVTIPDAGAPFAPTRSAVRSMDNIARITIAEDLITESDA